MKRRSVRTFVMSAAFLYAQVAGAQRIVANEGLSKTSNTREAEAVLARLVSVHVEQQTLLRAINAIGASAGIRVLYRFDALARYTAPISLSAKNVPLGTLLERALAHTALKVALAEDGHIMIVDTEQAANRDSTSIMTGQVTDATTHRPIYGAIVTLDGATSGTQTGKDGMFQIRAVSSGSHRITARLLGFMQQSKTVTVTSEEHTTVDFALQKSVNTLDQVVVTGTVIPTELRAVPNAITVITAKDIEQRGITHIDQLFRGDVPGVFAINQGANTPLDEVVLFSRGATSLTATDEVNRAYTVNNLFTTPMKTYVDGVELADPRYLSQIDPKSIERIEILTGPQASTIYGSNTINGVMQIFTKRGMTAQPQLTFNLLSGLVENNFSSARTPQHDYSAQLNGIEGRLSYNAGGSWNYMGPWTPAKQTSRWGGFGSIRFDLPLGNQRVTTDVSLRRMHTQNRQRGTNSGAQTENQELGWFRFITSGVSAPTTSTLTGQTVGVALSYMPTSWWSHEFNLGTDISDTERLVMGRGYVNRSDTTLGITQTHADLRSIRYTTTARLPLTRFARATVTMGADAWQNLTSAWAVSPQTLTGTLSGSTSISRIPGHNAGAFLQTQLSVGERLFITPGLRIEWNPGYGDKVRVLPGRYGAAYTQELGLMTMKLRGSYGRSTKPPAPILKQSIPLDVSATTVRDIYGQFDRQLANPELGPEYQQGGEGGVELYFGTRGSFIVTRYNQTVDNLIINVGNVDSVRSLLPCASPGDIVAPGECQASNAFVIDSAGHTFIYQSQNLNAADIRNQGWELQGSLNTGPFTTRGTYSWTKSRTIGVTPKYRAFFTLRNYPQYQPGAPFEFLAEHTWALGVTYARAANTLSINVNGTGQVLKENDDFAYRYLNFNIRLPQNRLNVDPSFYMPLSNGYVMADLNATHRLSSRFESMLQIQNLSNHYTNDFHAAFAVLGRQSRVGLRVRM